jgi:ParB family chromosome partitioning protein
MSIKSRLEAKTGDLVARVNDAKPSEPVKVSDDYKPKTGPGQMLAFGKIINEANAKISSLEEKLAEFKGSDVARKLDPKTIRSSHWANRNEDSFLTKEFESLKAEIESAGGNVQPIKVRPIPEHVGEYEIIFGHRRHRACLALGLDVLALIEELTDADLFAQMDRENRQRADLRPYEQGVMYAKALDEGLFSSNRKLAESLGVDVGGVGKLLALARLPSDVLKAFESPLDIQFQWGAVLSAAVQKDPELVLNRAREIGKTSPKPKATEVFHTLTTVGVDSVYPLAQEPILLTGKSGTKAKVSFDTKKKSITVSFAGVSVKRIPELEQLIKKFIEK